MRKLAALALALTLCPAVSRAADTGAPGDWKVLADCAGAYRANAEIRDPDRAPSMVSSIRDEAQTYVDAAKTLLQQGEHVPAADAGRQVAMAAGQSARRYGQMAREDLDRVIEACPQTDH